MPAKRKRTPRDHDAAIAALRREALRVFDNATEMSGPDRTCALLIVSAHELAADYLASITGKVERAAKGKK